MIREHGEAIQAAARRWSSSPEDAEDAYQRALEILLTRTPDLPEDELVPWMKTVVKHEAFALYRGRKRWATTPSAGDELDPVERAPSGGPEPHEQVETQERLQLGAEAIAKLKPQERHALLLRAEGLSYQQICEATGWTYTKVNRCLTEGRRSFVQRIAGIESGAECERLAPLLSALADGEAGAAQMGRLRPHLRSCLCCRATLRHFRELPHRTAEVVPVAATGGASERMSEKVSGWLDSLGAWVQERVTLAGVKLQAATETASAGKVAAVAASGVALVSGGIVAGSLEREPPEPAPPPASDRQRAGPEPLLPTVPKLVSDRVAERLEDELPVPAPLPDIRSLPSDIADVPEQLAGLTERVVDLPNTRSIPVGRRGESVLGEEATEDRAEMIDPLLKPVDPSERQRGGEQGGSAGATPSPGGDGTTDSSTGRQPATGGEPTGSPAPPSAPADGSEPSGSPTEPNPEPMAPVGSSAADGSAIGRRSGRPAPTRAVVRIGRD